MNDFCIWKKKSILSESTVNCYWKFRRCFSWIEIKMAPSLLSNTSILLADAIVKEKDKTTEFGTHMPRKTQKVTTFSLSSFRPCRELNYNHFNCIVSIVYNNSFTILFHRKRHIFKPNSVISCGKMCWSWVLFIYSHCTGFIFWWRAKQKFQHLFCVRKIVIITLMCCNFGQLI